MFKRPDRQTAAAVALRIEDAPLRIIRPARLGEAETIYRQMLNAEPGHLDAFHLLGVVALQRGRAQEAVDLISQSLAGVPTTTTR